MTPNATLLFAAGLGTRMAPLTHTRPKPLVEVAGKTLLDHALDLVPNVPRVVVNTHYLGHMIRDHLRDRPVTISDESDALLETGGGLKNAMPLLDSDPVFTLNTDAVWTGPNPADTLRDHWDVDRMEALLLLVSKDRAAGHSGQGDFVIGDDGRIAPGPGAIYTGFQIIRTNRLEEYPDGPFSMWDIWNDMLARGTMFGVTHPGGWCDVGRPASIAIAEAMLEAAE